MKSAVLLEMSINRFWSTKPCSLLAGDWVGWGWVSQWFIYSVCLNESWTEALKEQEKSKRMFSRRRNKVVVFFPQHRN